MVNQGYPVREAASRLGVSIDSMCLWVRGRRKAPLTRQADNVLAVDRRLQVEFKRVIEERGILKRPQRTLPGVEGEDGSAPARVRCHGGRVLKAPRSDFYA